MNMRNDKRSVTVWIVSMIAGAAAGCVITDPDRGFRLAVLVLLPSAIILPLLTRQLPQLCPILIMVGLPIGNCVAETWFGAHIGNLYPPFYYAWTLLWVAIGGIPSAAIRWNVLNDRKTAQQPGPVDGSTRA